MPHFFANSVNDIKTFCNLLLELRECAKFLVFMPYMLNVSACPALRVLCTMRTLRALLLYIPSRLMHPTCLTWPPAFLAWHILCAFSGAFLYKRLIFSEGVHKTYRINFLPGFKKKYWLEAGVMTTFLVNYVWGNEN